MSPRASQRGSALLLVLTFATLLAAFASAALHESMSEARAAATFADAMQADELGHAAAALTGAYVSGGAGRLRAGAFVAHFAQASLRITYLNEAARVDVNMAPSALLAALIEEAGAEPDLAAAVKTSIDRFRNSSTPSRAGTNASPPRLRDPAEIIDAFGVPEALAGRVLPALTIANGSAQVDPTLASRAIIVALFAGAENRADDFIAKREQGFTDPQTALLLLPETSRSFVGFDLAPAVEAHAEVSLSSGLRRRYEMVLTPASQSDPALRVHAWHPIF